MKTVAAMIITAAMQPIIIPIREPVPIFLSSVVHPSLLMIFNKSDLVKLNEKLNSLYFVNSFDFVGFGSSFNSSELHKKIQIH